MGETREVGYKTGNSAETKQMYSLGWKKKNTTKKYPTLNHNSANVYDVLYIKMKCQEQEQSEEMSRG